METKSNHVLVGAVALLLFVALFGFILWIARFDTGNEKDYDVFFESVSGLARGSAVNYSGVPVGSVREIAILPDSPEFVRVRIRVQQNTPILQGTRATLSSVGFTGVAIVSLDGAMKGAPPISEDGPFGVPVIPTAPGTIDSLLNAAPQLLDQVTELTERLTLFLDDRNMESIAGILENTQRVTGALAARDEDISASVTEARQILANLQEATGSISRLADSSAALIDEEGRPTLAQLRQTLVRTDAALTQIEQVAARSGDTVDRVNQQTLPEVNLLLRDLRRASSSLGAIASKLDEDPAGALIGGRTLPTYEPGESE
ncbi:MlaD family protein [Pacificimonas flava]|uniref:ABC-type transport system periplasmic component n=1 Tax=Pacificimonas flava TaxID=1234595 RepID=M2TL71_9SPHN|nr:MlaD family protein [Pacificimonas flava]EMD82401.1 ABC-type transport system periplasmic component [Pacificimonas flava]MBB5281235.1 phospholipid/cholesterol/gamma-HCH transport system substrate-binding protein [Pacificimonas flava]